MKRRVRGKTECPGCGAVLEASGRVWQTLPRVGFVRWWKKAVRPLGGEAIVALEVRTCACGADLEEERTLGDLQMEISKFTGSAPLWYDAAVQLWSELRAELADGGERTHEVLEANVKRARRTTESNSEKQEMK